MKPAKKMNERVHFKLGVISIIGGVFVMSFGGCFFLWANISQYVLSYLYEYH